MSIIDWIFDQFQIDSIISITRGFDACVCLFQKYSRYHINAQAVSFERLTWSVCPRRVGRLHTICTGSHQRWEKFAVKASLLLAESLTLADGTKREWCCPLHRMVNKTATLSLYRHSIIVSKHMTHSREFFLHWNLIISMNKNWRENS